MPAFQDPARFRFLPGAKIDLAALPTRSDARDEVEREARARLRKDARRLARAQSLLVLFQGMDASGKDEAIAAVMAAVDPQGCEYKQFQQPTAKELRHDYLWTAAQALPARGQIGIFNRSYYEHVVTDRVHPEKLAEQGLPSEAHRGIWAARCRQINAFERYLVENGILVVKLFLHISKAEQRRRLLARLERPEQRWQFSPSDVEDHRLWDAHMAAYSTALTRTNTALAPWHVIPADRPWFARAAVASVVVETLEALHDGYPEPDNAARAELEQARAALRDAAEGEKVSR
ncbi:MAG TPA: PPK2 family polyphosphate kinase [Rhodothermales bacterium]|nr:PPK2 family polyphosphate kinase [Rhodothermales bacterium]